MGWSLPYGYTWAEGGGLRKLTDEEMNAAAGPSAAPNEISTPPMFLDDNENIYKDQDGVIRNMKQAAGPTGSPSRPQYAYAPAAPRSPQSQEAWAGGGYGGGGRYGGGSTGTVRVSQPQRQGTMEEGGGNMAFSQSVGGGIRTQYSSLDPNAWGQDPTSTLQQVGTAAQGAVNAGDSLMGVNPTVGSADRMLYDRYQSLLLNPSSMMNDQNVGFMLDQSQEAARRQLAAGRMRHSGNALTELAQVTSGNLMGQFRNLADVYRGGADTEFGRWQGQTGAGLDAARIRAGALQGAAQAYTGAGQLGNQSAQAMNERAKLDLDRVFKGIASPQEEYRASQQAYQRALGWNEQVYAGQRGPSPFGVGVSNLYTQGQIDALRPASTYQNWVNSNWGGSPYSGYGAGQGYSYRGYGL